METAKEKFERKMAYIREHFGLSTYEEVEAAYKARPLDIAIFVEKPVISKTRRKVYEGEV